MQIVSTNEALLDRRLAEIPTSEWGDLSIDITPREYVLDYLSHSFPTQLFDHASGKVKPTPNLATLARAAEALAKAGRGKVEINAPGTTSSEILPMLANAGATQVTKNGQNVSGFGRINTGSTFIAPRNGQLVARFQW